MQSHLETLRDGTQVALYVDDYGTWACPVCGSVELSCQPYAEGGAASFEMCGCGFEFGFDDDPGASATALPSVVANWEVWRERLLRKVRSHPAAHAQVIARLRAIGVHEAS
jgi:hypothetical protein